MSSPLGITQYGCFLPETAQSIANSINTVGGGVIISGGGTDAIINSALNHAGNTVGTVRIGPGTYKLSNPIIVPNSHTRVICDANATFQAQGNFPSTFPMVQLANVTDVTWVGGIFDGNNIAGYCLIVNAGCDRTLIGQVETKNATIFQIAGASRTSGILEIINSYLHSGSVQGIYDFAASGNTAILKVRDCRFDSIMATACGTAGSGSGGANGAAYFEASGNIFTNCGSSTGGGGSGSPLHALYAIQSSFVNWHHNTFLNCFGALHVDFCRSGSICDNYISGSTGAADVLVEVTPYVSVERNIVMGNIIQNAIVLGVGSNNQGPSDLSVPVVGVSVKSNKVVNCLGGIQWGALTEGVFCENYVENPTNGLAYVNENSILTRFAFNQSVFSSGGTHLTVDAPRATASVNTYGDQSNAATMYSQTNGGTVTTKVS